MDEYGDGSLNPCSNGRCSARKYFYIENYDGSRVLILVLMEDALRDRVSVSLQPGDVLS